MIDNLKELKQNESAVLVALQTPKQSREKVEEYLDELAFLAQTLSIDVKERFTQRLERPDARTFVGKGKLEEIKQYVEEHQIDTIIFDDELSPSQVRNLEKYFNRRIYDRNLLILYIFWQRAQTAQAKTQVELAQYEYLLPRLTGLWSHLERQRGGTGTRSGAGEKEIETDRRIVKQKIALLKKKLEKIDKQNQTRRKQRHNMVRVSFVGYTNVGKSTLMNLLTKSDLLAENKLFATLDSTVRKVVWEGIPFLIADTVGFIRKLPATLVESFKSTLDEVREADILVHVVDITHPSFDEQIEVVNQTLRELGAADKDVLLVFNKVDALPEEKQELPLLLQQSHWVGKVRSIVSVSALQKQGIDELRSKLLSIVKEHFYQIYPNYLNTH
ncbi:GTP-binding protein HflX [Thermonema lapsum]|uniref:GTPase HflX n=1 Tax=Thermonema lapsum TaxID=28195 RepID=A0A846MNX7_9BACT|nr:GTPase HflX [Thermonema lapsum]NIK73288.1 GTP-binding protein HflX [Thermonema lapsum]